MFLLSPSYRSNHLPIAEVNSSDKDMIYGPLDIYKPQPLPRKIILLSVVNVPRPQPRHNAVTFQDILSRKPSHVLAQLPPPPQLPFNRIFNSNMNNLLPLECTDKRMISNKRTNNLYWNETITMPNKRVYHAVL